MSEKSLLETIKADVKEAMLNKETQRLQTLRLLTAAIKQREIDKRTAGHAEVADRSQALSDMEILETLDKMIKQRRESIAQFTQGNRADLAEQEQAEIDILAKYLPPALSDPEVENLIRQAIAATQASSPKDMGKVIAHLKPQVQGRVDMGKVSGKVKALLGQ